MLIGGIFGLTTLNNPKLSPKQKKIFKPLFIILIVIGAILVITSSFNKPKSNDVRDYIEQINSSVAGKYVADETIIDSVVLGNQNEVIFNYSVVSIKLSDLNDSIIEDFNNHLIINAKNDSNFRTNFLDKGIPVIVRYFGSDSVLITEFEIK